MSFGHSAVSKKKKYIPVLCFLCRACALSFVSLCLVAIACLTVRIVSNTFAPRLDSELWRFLQEQNQRLSDGLRGERELCRTWASNQQQFVTSAVKQHEAVIGRVANIWDRRGVEGSSDSQSCCGRHRVLAVAAFRACSTEAFCTKLTKVLGHVIS